MRTKTGRQTASLRRQCRRQQRPVRDAGIGLIEVLVSVVLLGTVGTAVLACVTAAALGASTQRDVAAAQAFVSAAADDLAATSIEFAPCATADAYNATVGDAITVEHVQFWDGAHWRPTTSAECDPAADTLQLITISATQRRGTATVHVTKRRAVADDVTFVTSDSAGQPTAPGAGTEITPGIDGPTATTAPTTTPTTAPASTTTTVPHQTTTTTTPPATTTTTTTTTAPTTTAPNGGPTCAVTSIVANPWWKDTLTVRVRNATQRTWAASQWHVELTYAGVGAEQHGHYTSSWVGGQLTLTPAASWITLNPGTRDIAVLEPGGTTGGVYPAQILCEVHTS